MQFKIIDLANRQDILQSMLQALKPAVLFPSVVTGVLIWVTKMVLGNSYSAFVFQGRLSAYIGVGFGMYLVSLTVLSIFSAILSSEKSVVPSPQDTPVVILSTVIAGLVALAPAELSDQALFATAFATMILATILTGIGFFVVGFLRVSILMRYIPYPVVGGVLAGMGWLLVQGSLTLMTELELTRYTWTQLFGGEILWHWLPAVVLVTVVTWLIRRTKNVFILPLAVMLSLAAFFVSQALDARRVDEPVASVTQAPASADVNKYASFEIESLANVDLSLVITQAGGIAVLIVFSTLNLLAYVSGSELIFRRELDFNRELAVAGSANVLAGLFGGGFVGYPTLAYSALAHQSGGHGRIINLVVAALSAASLAIGASGVVTFPFQILGGVMMFFGFSFLVDWLYDARRQMPKHDYFIVVVMMLVIATFGLLWGIVAGILISIAFFVLQYSRIDVIRQEYSGDKYRSTIDRSHAENRLLRESGDRIRIFRLQGYIFFGTGYQLYQHIRSRILDDQYGEVRFIILDFRLVQQLDISTVVDFTKLRQMTEASGIDVLLTNSSPSIMAVLQNSSFAPSDGSGLKVFNSLDHALEWCENELLIHGNMDNISRVPVSKLFGSHTKVPPLAIEKLANYLVRVDALEGEIIAVQGQGADSLYLIESGKVDILLTEGHDEPMRLRSISAGTIVGEIGFYLGQPRSATIVATEPTVLQRLDRAALLAMELENPQAASAFHTYVSCVLAERLTTTNHMVESLMD